MLDNNVHRLHRRMPMRQVWTEYQRMQNTASEYDRKHVYSIECRDCNALLTNRGMNAVLLSDRSIELFSTDLLPDRIGLVEGDYSAVACTCRVRDSACHTCGNIVGYHVNVPCKVCLSQPNNGHFWMFRSISVRARPIFIQMVGENKMRDLPLLWGFVHSAGEFETGYFKSGDEIAAHQSCQLSVKLTSNIKLITKNPVTRIEARSKDGEMPDDTILPTEDSSSPYSCKNIPLPYPITRHIVKQALGFYETDHSDPLGKLMSSAPIGHYASHTYVSAPLDLSKPFVLLPFDPTRARPEAMRDSVCVRIMVPPSILNPYPTSEFHYRYEPYPPAIPVSHIHDNGTSNFHPAAWWDMLQVSSRHLVTNASVPINMRPWAGYPVLDDAFRDIWFSNNADSLPDWSRRTMKMMVERQWVHVYEADVVFPDDGPYALEANLEFQDAYWNVEHGPVQPYSAVSLPVKPSAILHVRDENKNSDIIRIVEDHLALPLCRLKSRNIRGRWLPWPFEDDDPRLAKITGLDRHGKFWAPYACRYRHIEHNEFFTCLANRYEGKIAIYGDSNIRRSVKSFMTNGQWCQGYHHHNVAPEPSNRKSSRHAWPAKLFDDASLQPMPHQTQRPASPSPSSVNTDDMKDASNYAASPQQWSFSPTTPQLRSCRCEDYREESWDPQWFNASARRQDIVFGDQVLASSYKWDGLTFINDPYWTSGFDESSNLTMPRDSRVVIVSLGNWDMAYSQLTEYRDSLLKLVSLINAHYDHHTLIVYRSPQFYCCRVDMSERFRQTNSQRLYVFDNLARHILESEFNGRLVHWDTMHMGEARTWEEKFQIASTCPSNHAQADVVHLENQVLMNTLCNDIEVNENGELIT
ncbi:hypothetical protein DM01DRAFT_1384390 [Hesseltinella vesiculosa]|uniref:Uncharacterized protein n=1 Tax=Hesseltinella vesiculosa TaxID=101127 RepID=A0A1X2GE53_9FUNG|nr:hypothetical protein DM01DRAFT_1384390 [Hesseltinella vesiculosa]